VEGFSAGLLGGLRGGLVGGSESVPLSRFFISFLLFDLSTLMIMITMMMKRVHVAHEIYDATFLLHRNDPYVMTLMKIC